MNTIRFGDLPIAVRLTVGIAFFAVWVAFEVLVVNPYGLWRYMPFYRIGGPCAWDGAAALVISIWLVVASRSVRR
ncbi:MAG: hypothetical protein KGJ79_18335 [Alphaproteobacteria bacterium]|nr:hypothetical protein [Alphaproteobacteria bacterium]MDE2495638.1 hypothetical protein [Alphaproteobacteria bacterium]